MLSWTMFMVRSIGVSRKSPCKPYPALFSRTSIVTDLASRLLFRRLAAPGEARSIASTSTSTPYLRRRSEASFSIGSCRRAANTRLTFCAASRSANSRPRPLDAPVIKAHFPAKLFIASFDIGLFLIYLIGEWGSGSIRTPAHPFKRQRRREPVSRRHQEGLEPDQGRGRRARASARLASSRGWPCACYGTPRRAA